MCSTHITVRLMYRVLQDGVDKPLKWLWSGLWFKKLRLRSSWLIGLLCGTITWLHCERTPAQRALLDGTCLTAELTQSFEQRDVFVVRCHDSYCAWPWCVWSKGFDQNWKICCVTDLNLFLKNKTKLLDPLLLVQSAATDSELTVSRCLQWETAMDNSSFSLQARRGTHEH